MSDTQQTVDMSCPYFVDNIIAQDDDCDWEESGYVVVALPKKKYAIFHYSHCSCYGTWESLTGDGYSSGNDAPVRTLTPMWVGTKAGLLKLAKNLMDPAMPKRVASTDDYDHDHLMAVYGQVIEYFEKKEGAVHA